MATSGDVVPASSRPLTLRHSGSIAILTFLLCALLSVGVWVATPTHHLPSAKAAVTPIGTITNYGLGLKRPTAITTGPDGNLWFTNTDNNSIGRVTPSGVVANFTDPLVDNPTAIASGPGGDVWFVNDQPRSIGRITPLGVITAVSIEPYTASEAIAAGPDGNLWFLSTSPGAVVRLNPAGMLTAFPTTTFPASYGITAGPDGNLWITTRSDTILRVTPAGTITSFADPGIDGAMGITGGPDGNLWFTGHGPNLIGRITPTGSITLFADPTISAPTGITAGPDGAVWFANAATNSVGRINMGGTVSSVPLAGIDRPEAITLGPDQNLWLLTRGDSAIVRLTPTGGATVFRGSGVNVPWWATSGPDGNLWFTNGGNNTIGRATTDGAISWFGHPSIRDPLGITAGPDGNVWFINSGNNTIGRVTPSGMIVAFTHSSIDDPAGITGGPDGNVWFTNRGNSTIGRISPSGVVTSFSDPRLRNLEGIVTATNGVIWFVDHDQRALGRIKTDGVVTSFVPVSGGHSQIRIAAGTDGSIWSTNDGAVSRFDADGTSRWFAGPGIDQPIGIAAGPDGNMWFTDIGPRTGAEPVGGTVGRITADGVVTSFHDPSIAMPTGISSGADGSLWFLNTASNSIGRITAATPPGMAGAPSPAPAGAGAVRLSWTAPTADGGAPITTYQVTASPGGKQCDWSFGPRSCTISGLPTGVPLTFTVIAGNVVGTGAASPASVPITLRDGSWFHGLTPTRVQDSRPASQVGPYLLPWGPGEERLIEVAGGGPAGSRIPEGVDSVALNVTATNTSAASFLSLGPAADSPIAPPLTTSSINWPAGITIANQVTVPLSSDGRLRVRNASGWVDVIIDVTGYFAADGAVVGGDPITDAGAGFTPLDPARILDSRTPGSVGPFTSPWEPGSIRAIPVAGLAGVPVDAEAVSLNVTVTGTTASSFLTLWPAGAAQPTASTLNWVTGQTIPNAATVSLGEGGQVWVFNPSGKVDVIVDVNGYYRRGSGAAFHPIAPKRILDSRPESSVGGYTTPWSTGTIRPVNVGGTPAAPEVPTNAVAVVANLTVTATSAPSFLTAWPTGVALPMASNMNWVTGRTIANAITVRLGAPGGTVNLFNSAGNVHVIADVSGYFR